MVDIFTRKRRFLLYRNLGLGEEGQSQNKKIEIPFEMAEATDRPTYRPESNTHKLTTVANVLLRELPRTALPPLLLSSLLRARRRVFLSEDTR